MKSLAIFLMCLTFVSCGLIPFNIDLVPRLDDSFLRSEAALGTETVSIPSISNLSLDIPVRLLPLHEEDVHISITQFATQLPIDTLSTTIEMRFFLVPQGSQLTYDAWANLHLQMASKESTDLWSESNSILLGSIGINSTQPQIITSDLSNRHIALIQSGEFQIGLALENLHFDFSNPSAQPQTVRGLVYSISEIRFAGSYSL